MSAAWYDKERPELRIGEIAAELAPPAREVAKGVAPPVPSCPKSFRMRFYGGRAAVGDHLGEVIQVDVAVTVDVAEVM